MTVNLLLHKSPAIRALALSSLSSLSLFPSSLPLSLLSFHLLRVLTGNVLSISHSSPVREDAYGERPSLGTDSAVLSEARGLFSQRDLMTFALKLRAFTPPPPSAPSAPSEASFSLSLQLPHPISAYEHSRLYSSPLLLSSFSSCLLPASQYPPSLLPHALAFAFIGCHHSVSLSLRTGRGKSPLALTWQHPWVKVLRKLGIQVCALCVYVCVYV